MKALVILHDGSEIPSYVLDQMMALLAADPQRKSVTTYRLNNDDIANAIVAHVAGNALGAPNKIDAEQTAIDNAVEYIAKTVLSTTTDPTICGLIIASRIAKGDERMAAAVEILATAKSIPDQRFNKSFIKVLRNIHKNVL